jgi:hypothetical protein
VAEKVASGYIRVPFSVFEYEIDGEKVYDWIAGDGQDEDHWHSSVEEALDAVESFFGGEVIGE